MSVDRTTRRNLQPRPPHFTQSLVARPDGQCWLLECRVDGYPKPDIRWEHAGQTLARSRRVHLIRTGDRCVVELRTPNARGVYTCIADNTLGTATTHLTLTAPNGKEMADTSKKPNELPKSLTRSRSTHQNTLANRSLSKTRKNNSSLPSKTKFPSFKSHISSKDGENSMATANLIAELKNKQISKSVEDTRCGASEASGGRGYPTGSTSVEVACEEEENFRMSTRERIAAYLRRLETSTFKQRTTQKQKTLQSLKQKAVLERYTSDVSKQNTSQSLKLKTTESLKRNTSDSLKQNSLISLKQNSLDSLNQNTLGSFKQNTSDSSEQNTLNSLENTTGFLKKNTSQFQKQKTAEPLKRNTSDSLKQNSLDSLNQNTLGSFKQNTSDSLEQNTFNSLENTSGFLKKNTSRSQKQKTAEPLKRNTSDSLEQKTLDSFKKKSYEKDNTDLGFGGIFRWKKSLEKCPQTHDDLTCPLSLNDNVFVDVNHDPASVGNSQISTSDIKTQSNENGFKSENNLFRFTKFRRRKSSGNRLKLVQLDNFQKVLPLSQQDCSTSDLNKGKVGNITINTSEEAFIEPKTHKDNASEVTNLLVEGAFKAESTSDIDSDVTKRLPKSSNSFFKFMKFKKRRSVENKLDQINDTKQTTDNEPKSEMKSNDVKTNEVTLLRNIDTESIITVSHISDEIVDDLKSHEETNQLCLGESVGVVDSNNSVNSENEGSFKFCRSLESNNDFVNSSNNRESGKSVGALDSNNSANSSKIIESSKSVGVPDSNNCVNSSKIIESSKSVGVPDSNNSVNSSKNRKSSKYVGAQDSNISVNSSENERSLKFVSELDINNSVNSYNNRESGKSVVASDGNNVLISSENAGSGKSVGDSVNSSENGESGSNKWDHSKKDSQIYCRSKNMDSYRQIQGNSLDACDCEITRQTNLHTRNSSKNGVSVNDSFDNSIIDTNNLSENSVFGSQKEICRNHLDEQDIKMSPDSANCVVTQNESSVEDHVTIKTEDGPSCETDADFGSYTEIDVGILDSIQSYEEAFSNSIASTSNVSWTPDETFKGFPEEDSHHYSGKSVPTIYIEKSPDDDPDDDWRLILSTPREEKIVSYQEVCCSLPDPVTLNPDPQRASSPLESGAHILRPPQSLTVLRGEAFTLAVGYSGEPQPNVTWIKRGCVLRDDGRVSIQVGRDMSVMSVSSVTADDSGKYVVSVENDAGGQSCFASVAVVGFPEPPGSEPTVSEATDHSVVLSWYGCMYDGGSAVTGYQVEMCTLPDKKWYTVATSVNTSCSVVGLSRGQRYVFRIRAENRCGTSTPSKESQLVRLDDYLEEEEDSSEEENGLEEAAPVQVENGDSFKERFDLKEEVGKGRFGTVYRCVEVCSGRAVAAKVIRCLKRKDKEKVQQEIDIMSRLHHPKLMQVLAAFDSSRNMIMVMEFICGGELFERVIADDFVLTEQDCILFMRQICHGVAYMHNHHVIHLDLKPENILCKTHTSHKIKIIDFGLARIYKEDESLRVLFGTPEFVAPEVINYEPVCPSSDMWSIGVICYVLLSGLSPFMGDSDSETFANITRGDMDFDDVAFEQISQEAKDFIARLLVKRVRDRMGAEECLQHPWLATSGHVQKRPLSTEKLKRFIIRRKWQKSGTAIRALGRMVSLSRSSLGSSCDSPVGSPTSSRSSRLSRSETGESSDCIQEETVQNTLSDFEK